MSSDLDDLAIAAFEWWASHSGAAAPGPPELPICGPARGRWVHAVHEAAHACAGLLGGIPIEVVYAFDPAAPGDLALSGINGGAVRPAACYRAASFHAAAVFLLSGYAAAARVSPVWVAEDPEVQMSSDYASARELIAARVGVADPWHPRVTRELRRLERAAAAVVDANWPWVVAVARALHAHGRLSGGEVAGLSPARKRPR